MVNLNINFGPQNKSFFESMLANILFFISGII